jgi:hypothetical protein
MHFSSSTRIAILLFALSLIRGLIYSAVIPPWQAPDEPQHFEYVRLLYDKQRLVTGQDISSSLRDEITASMRTHGFWWFAPVSPNSSEDEDPSQRLSSFWANTESQLYQPPLYYVVAALALPLTAHRDVTVQLYATRLISVLMGAGVVLLAYLSIRALFPRDLFLQIGVPGFIIFLPMHTHITSSANNGNLAELMASAIVYLITISLKQGLSLMRIVLMGLVLIAGFYSKRTFFFAVPLSLLAIPVSLWLDPPRISWRRAVGVAVGLGGTGLTAIMLWQREKPLQFWSSLYLNLGFNHRFDLRGMFQMLPLRYSVYATTLFEGFWARFGWWSVRLDPAWYWLILLLCLVALAGLLVLMFRLARGFLLYAAWQRASLALYIFSVVLAVLVVVLTFLAINATGEGFFRTTSPQGRLLFPAIIPIATLFLIGVREVIPINWRPWGLVLGLLGLILFDLLALIRYIIPFYYG